MPPSCLQLQASLCTKTPDHWPRWEGLSRTERIFIWLSPPEMPEPSHITTSRRYTHKSWCLLAPLSNYCRKEKDRQEQEMHTNQRWEKKYIHTLQVKSKYIRCCVVHSVQPLNSWWHIHWSCSCFHIFIYLFIITLWHWLSANSSQTVTSTILYSLSKNPEVLPTQGNVSAEERSISEHISLSSTHPALLSSLSCQRTHMYTPPLQNNKRILWSPVVKKRKKNLTPPPNFFLIAAYSISRITAAQLRRCSSLARVCQAQRGFCFWSTAQYRVCMGGKVCIHAHASVGKWALCSTSNTRINTHTSLQTHTLPFDMVPGF